MLPEQLVEDHRRFTFWNATGAQTDFLLQLPEIRGMDCHGSGYGWLLFADNETKEIYLFNPFTRVKIRMPDEPFFWLQPQPNSPDVEFFVRKGIIINNPSVTPDYSIAAIIFGRVFYVSCPRDRNARWKVLSYERPITDIVHIRSVLYAISGHLGLIEGIDLRHKTRWTLTWENPIPANLLSRKKYKSYLLEVSGARLFGMGRPLLLKDDTLPLNKSLVIFRLSKASSNYGWEEESIQNLSLFFGETSSMVLYSVPPESAFKRNCMYFTHSTWLDKEKGQHDLSLYNFENETYEQISVRNEGGNSDFPLTWITFNPKHAA